MRKLMLMLFSYTSHETHIHIKVFHSQCELSVNIFFIQYEMKSHLLSEYLVSSLSEFYLNDISIFSPLHWGEEEMRRSLCD